MIRLDKALAAWGGPDFASVLQREIEGLRGKLPLQQGLARSSYALEDGLRAVILAVAEEDDCIRVKAGIFYAGIVAGCNCADDPTPVEPQPEYCEVMLTLDKRSAETTVSLVSE